MTKRKSRASVISVGLILTSALVFTGIVRASTGASKECSRSDIKITIKTITYEGRDNYSLITSVINDSSQDVRVSRFEEHFFMQTKKGWYLLRTIDVASDAANGVFLLSQGAKKEYSARLNIPINMPETFRTYEGDISLMQRYTLRCIDGSGNESQKTDEVLYWVTPRTAKWTLREGM